MKRQLYIVLLMASAAAWGQNAPYRPITLRAPAQYLSTNEYAVEDTCHGHNILKQFSCNKNTPDGYTCFDVYMTEGDPVDSERYTLLNQSVSEVPESAQPQCPFQQLDCAEFLRTLRYNLNFSWFIDNFPSSSFPQCAETYSCTRISCLAPLPDAADGSPRAQKLSCVFKKNQIFFLGSQIICKDKNTR